MDTFKKYFNKTRNIIADIIEPHRGKFISFFYELFMLFLVIFSIVPLMYKEGTGGAFIETLRSWNIYFLIVFIVDWLLRWLTSDLRWPDHYEKHGWKQFLIYPFTIWSLIDLTAIIPSFFPGLAWFKSLRAIRILKSARISPALWTGITFVFRAIFKQWKLLAMVLTTFTFIIFIGSIILFQVEYPVNPKINNYGDAIWFTFITITTIGYGDITPITEAGKVFAGLFAIFGIINIALITGISVWAFTLEIDNYKKSYAKGELKLDRRKLAIAFKKKNKNITQNKKHTRHLDSLLIYDWEISDKEKRE